MDETGWGVYEECRRGGAIIATTHAHNYSRTHLLSSMTTQTVASTANTLRLEKGKSFVAVAGLGGINRRSQKRDGPWWAAIAAPSCLAGSPTCRDDVTYGALFCVFHVNGQPDRASCYFKDIRGTIGDAFELISAVNP